MTYLRWLNMKDWKMEKVNNDTKLLIRTMRLMVIQLGPRQRRFGVGMLSLVLNSFNWGTFGTFRYSYPIRGKSEIWICICDAGWGWRKRDYCSSHRRVRVRSTSDDQDGWIRETGGPGRKKEQMSQPPVFLRTTTLFSSLSVLSTTFSNIPMFFIYIPSVSQIFEAAYGKDIQ